MKRVRKTALFGFTVAVMLSLGLLAGPGSAAGDVPRLSAQQLKEMLGQPDLVVLDVRDPISWEKSGIKIPGALRVDAENVSAWADTIPKDKTVVLYCA